MTLLQATYGWEDVYKANPDGKADKTEEDLRRSMNPGTAQDKHHWNNWAVVEKYKNVKKNKNKKDETMDVDGE
jgi:hypothetical protein